MKEIEEYIKELHKRYTEIEEAFKDFPIKPTSVSSFTKFLAEHVAEIAGNYVILNTFTKPALPKDEVNKREGMVVAEVPAAPKKVDIDEVKLEDGVDDDIYFKGDK